MEGEIVGVDEEVDGECAGMTEANMMGWKAGVMILRKNVLWTEELIMKNDCETRSH